MPHCVIKLIYFLNSSQCAGQLGYCAITQIAPTRNYLFIYKSYKLILNQMTYPEGLTINGTLLEFEQ